MGEFESTGEQASSIQQHELRQPKRAIFARTNDGDSSPYCPCRRVEVSVVKTDHRGAWVDQEQGCQCLIQ